MAASRFLLHHDVQMCLIISRAPQRLLRDGLSSSSLAAAITTAISMMHCHKQQDNDAVNQRG